MLMDAKTFFITIVPKSNESNRIVHQGFGFRVFFRAASGEWRRFRLESLTPMHAKDHKPFATNPSITQTHQQPLNEKNDTIDSLPSMVTFETSTHRTINQVHSLNQR
jgi:hypothetical protein